MCLLHCAPLCCCAPPLSLPQPSAMSNVPLDAPVRSLPPQQQSEPATRTTELTTLKDGRVQELIREVRANTARSAGERMGFARRHQNCAARSLESISSRFSFFFLFPSPLLQELERMCHSTLHSPSSSALSPHIVGCLSSLRGSTPPSVPLRRTAEFHQLVDSAESEYYRGTHERFNAECEQASRGSQWGAAELLQLTKSRSPLRQAALFNRACQQQHSRGFAIGMLVGVSGLGMIWAAVEDATHTAAPSRPSTTVQPKQQSSSWLSPAAAAPAASPAPPADNPVKAWINSFFK